MRSYDGFFVPGQASFDYVRSFGVEPERIAIAPNAVDASVFGGPREAGDGTVRFLYVGRLDPEKGLDVLLRAFEDVPGELVLVGSGTGGGRAARARQRPSPVHGRAAARRGRGVVPRADAFVLPSRSEPWGMVLNEAATAGLPLVATDGVGAAHELIEDGVNGFRVPVGDERRSRRRCAGSPTTRRSAPQPARARASSSLG